MRKQDFFCQECEALKKKTPDKYPHLPHVRICQSIWSPLIFFLPLTHIERA